MRHTLRRQSRKIIYDVYCFMKKEGANLYEGQIRARTAEATKTSVATIKRIINEAKQTNLVFRTPGKKRSGVKRVVGIDSFKQGIMRRTIKNFYASSKQTPTVKKLLTKLQPLINFEGSEVSLRRLVDDFGFKWKNVENKTQSKVLIEKSSLQLQRINYLLKIKQYRQEGRPLIFADESYIDVTHTNTKNRTNAKGQRVVIVHAASEAGFLPNAMLVFMTGPKLGDHKDDINCESYAKWIKTQLIPNLPPRSVLIYDNAPYHNKEFDVAPNRTSKKSDLQAWLTDKRISFSSDMFKSQLHEIIKANKGNSRKFYIDKLLEERGHDVLRLPSQSSDLNPLEIAWTSIKDYVRAKNLQWNAYRVMKLVKEKIGAMGADELQEMCEKVKTIEDEYLQAEREVDRMTDELVIGGEPDSDSSSSDSDDFENIEADDEDELPPSEGMKSGQDISAPETSGSRENIQPCVTSEGVSSLSASDNVKSILWKALTDECIKEEEKCNENDESVLPYERKSPYIFSDNCQDYRSFNNSLFTMPLLVPAASDDYGNTHNPASESKTGLSLDKLKETERNPKRSQHEMEIEWPESKRSKGCDDGVNHLFLNYANTFKAFLPKDQTMLKLKLAQLFANTEMKAIQQENDFSRPPYNNEVGAMMVTDDQRDEDAVIHEHNYSTRTTQLNISSKELSAFMKDVTIYQEKILDILLRQEAGAYEKFSRYVSSLLATLSKEKALSLQPKIIEIITSECCEAPKETAKD